MTPKTYSVTTHPAGHGFHYLFPGKRKEEEGEGGGGEGEEEEEMKKKMASIM